MNSLVEINDRMRSCKGFEIHWKIGYLIKTHKMYFRNLDDLLAHLAKHSTHDSLLQYWGPGNKSKQENEFDEFFRLFHNSMASAKTLVDHSRIICRQLLKGKSLQRYEEFVKSEFEDDYLSNFIQKLRNFVQHQSHPSISVTADFQNNRIGYQINFELMRQWTGWNSNAIKYINSVKKSVFVEDIVVGYAKKVDNFNIWLVDYLKESNKDDLDQLLKINEELVKFYRDSGIPVTEKDWNAYGKKSKDVK